MKKNYISLQELNFKNAGLNELTINEMELIDGGVNWWKMLAGAVLIAVGAALECVSAGASSTLIGAGVGVMIDGAND